MPPAIKRRVAQSRRPPSPPRTRHGSSRSSDVSRAGSTSSQTTMLILPGARSVASTSPLMSPPSSISPSPAQHALERTSSRDSTLSVTESSSSSSISGSSEYIPMQRAVRMPSVSHPGFYTSIDGDSTDDAQRTEDALRANALPTDSQMMPPPTMLSSSKVTSKAKGKSKEKEKDKKKKSSANSSKVGNDSVLDPNCTPHTPRPPNAWIIYRSDMLKAISAGDPMPVLDKLVAEQHQKDLENLEAMPDSDNEDGTTPAPATKKREKKPVLDPIEPPTEAKGALRLGPGKTGRGLPQAQISKLISAMWKNEPKEVKRKYDRLSEQKKLEHLEKYPDYRFKPVPKDVKFKMQQAKADQRWRQKQEREKMITQERQEREKAQAIYAQIRRKIRGGPPQYYVDDVDLNDPQYLPYITAFHERNRENLVPSHAAGSRSRTAVPSLSPPPVQVDSADSAASPAAGTPSAGSEPPEEPDHRRAAKGRSTVFWAAEDYPHLPIPKGYEMPPFSVFPVAPPPPPPPAVSFPPRIDTPRSDTGKSFPPPYSYPFSSRPATLAYGEPRSLPAPERGYLVVPAEQGHASDSALDGPDFGGDRPLWQGQMMQSSYAVPYTFEPIPLPENVTVDQPIPYADYSQAMYDQEMIDRESSSLAAMWCMLDEEQEEEQGYPVWDVDSNEAVSQWSNMEIPVEAQTQQGFVLSSNIAEQIAAQWAQDQQAHPTETGLGEVRVTPFPDSGYLSYSFDGSQLGQRSTGPLVGGDIPLSPAERLFPSEINAHAMGDSTANGNRRVSTTYSDFGAPAATHADLGLEADTSNVNFIRHVSNSAYPQPNMIDDSSESGTPAEIRDWTGSSARYSAMPLASMSSTSSGKDESGKSQSLAWEDDLETPRALTFNTGPSVGRRRERAVASTYRSGASQSEQE